MYEYRGVEYLRHKLHEKEHRVRLRYRYYEMKENTRDRGLLIPPWMKGMYRSVVGWNTKSVDYLADRLLFEGFDENVFNTNAIFAMNNRSIFFDSAIREALIASCSFVHITHGEDNERIPRLSVLTAKDATGVIDEFTGMLREGYAVLDRDKDGYPIIEAYFTPDGTQYFEDGKPTYIEENPTGYPLLIPVVYRPSSERPFGHSRITRVGMYLQQFAQNTMERAEVSAEFYSFPQKYITGLDPDADPLDTWRASMSAFLRFDKDEDGDHPILGQFQQQSMSPYTEQLKMAASMFAGDSGLTLDDLGFVTDNPSSAEAIKASHESLRLIVRNAQSSFTNAFRNVGFVSAELRDNQRYLRSLIEEMRPIWMPAFEPDASALSVIGDGAIKINQAIPGYFNRDNLRELTGLEPSEDSDLVSVEEEAEELMPNE